MKRLYFSLCLCVTLFLVGGVHAQSQEALRELMQDRGEYYFTITLQEALEIPDLGNLCSVDGTDGTNVVCYANQEEYDKLLSLGVTPVFQTPPSLRANVTMWNGQGTYNWDTYLTYDQYVTMMQGFPGKAAAVNDGRTCTLFSLGTLSTSNHRQLLGVRINNGSPQGKPKFLYSSTMHGDEVTGMILMLRLIDELCTSTDSRIVNLLNDVDIYILPLTNPDGTYKGGNHTVNSAQRYNGNNVDLNRNYKDYFNGDHPDGNSYEDETTWTMNFADENLFTMAANYHGGAEVMNYCWDWVFENHADVDWWEVVCTEYVQLARQKLSTYMSDTYNDGVTNGATWYSITGSRQDYMNAFGQCREVTVECSSVKTPTASELPNFWNYNHNSMLAYMEQVRNGVHGVVYDAQTGQPIEGVKVSVLNHDIHHSYVTTHSVGDFHRPIKGGTYTFVFDKEGYARNFVEVTVADGQRVDLNVNLKQSSAPQMECYTSLTPTVPGAYLMGYLNGSTLVMPSHSNTTTSTSVSMSTTSCSVIPTDGGFTLARESEPLKISLNASGTAGQYYIFYKGRLLSRSSSTLSWAKPSNASGNGVSLTSYRWYVNDNGIYQQSSGTKYYLNYNGNTFTTSTSSGNVVFFVEGECPPAGFTVQASYDTNGGTVSFSSGNDSGPALYGLEGGEDITVSVSVNAGYTLRSITAMDSENTLVELTSNGNDTYSFNMPEADVTVSVVFDATDYTVSVADNLYHGMLLVNGSTSLCDAHAGQTINVTATPDPGFELATLYYIAEGTTTEVFITGGSFIMPAANLTLYATFAKDCFGEVTYERVTETPSDWSGTYLLVYQSSTDATSGRSFNGSVTGGDAYTTDITISDGTTINELGEAVELTIEKISGSDYYYIKHGSNYLYAQTTSLYEGSNASGTTYQWSLTMSGNYVNIHTAAASNQLYFNTSSNSGYYQRIYPASSNTTNLYLYRKTTSSSAATVSFSPESGTALSPGNRTVTLTSSIAGLPIYYTTDGTEPTMTSAHGISPITLRFNEAVTVKAFTYDDPENEGCGIGPLATATYGWATSASCYEQVSSVSTGQYVMGYLNGTTLVMPTHNNSSIVTSTSVTVTLTDNGFSAQEILPKVTLTANGNNGQYYISYNNRYLAKSNQGSSLTWSSYQQSNGRWYINGNGIYVSASSGGGGMGGSSTTNYYLYYNNGSFALSTNAQNNIHFYVEGDCPVVSYTISAVASPAEGGVIEDPVAAFNGEEIFYEGETCTLTATANEDYNFVHWTEDGNVVGTEATISFVVEGDRNLVANFEPATVVQTVNLVQGWNWWAPTVDATLADLEAALVTAVGADNYSITTLANGPVESLELGQMYKVKIELAEGCAFNLSGFVPSPVILTFTPGFNGFGYIGAEPASIAEALDVLTSGGPVPDLLIPEGLTREGFVPMEGDLINSFDEGFARYEVDGEGNGVWVGTLSTLLPGHGYVYVRVANSGMRNAKCEMRNAE